MKPTITCLIQSSCFVFSSSILVMPCMAQVRTDGTTATTVTSPDGNNFTINDGDQSGNNLFHSFQDFSVPSNGSAFFNNAVDINNIFSRVTGGNISNIDGLLRANGSANLFLINPAGIIFGSNARLDIGGSFLGSTADSLLFGDGTEFIATDGQNKPILTINAPIGLGFRDNPQDLQVQGSSLEVKPNRTLALVGGNLVFSGGDVKIPVLPEDFSEPSLPGGNIYAPSGRIELGSIATEGIVDIKSIASGWQLGYENVQNFDDIQLTDETTINASGEGGGSIQVQGSQVSLLDGSRFVSYTFSSQAGKDIVLKAKDLLLENSSIAGIITFAEGNGGNFIVNATDSVQLRGTAPDIFPISIIGSQTAGNGNAGNLNITTRKLITEDGAQISSATFSQGKAGELFINSSELVEISGTSGDISSGIFSDSQGNGKAGNILIETKNLIVRDGGEILLSTFGQSKAGNLKIVATESVQLLRTPVDNRFATGLFVQSRGGGDAGNLEIDTKRLIVEDGAFISSSASKFNPFTEIEITNFSSRAGDLTIRATELVEVKGTSGTFSSNINSISEGTANAGKLSIETENLIVQDGAFISSSTFGDGDGGNIFLSINNNLSLRNNSRISAQATNNADGGNVTINTKFIIASPQQNNDIIAIAEEGIGGNINITAEGIFGLEERSSTPANNTNDIDASSEFGLDGTVTINAPDVGSLQETIEAPIIVELQTLGMNACAGGGTGTSNFNITGKGSVPPQLIAPLSSETIFIEEKSIPISMRKQEKIKPLVTTKGEIYPARGIVFLDNGDIVLTAYPTSNIQRTPSSSSNCRKS